MKAILAEVLCSFTLTTFILLQITATHFDNILITDKFTKIDFQNSVLFISFSIGQNHYPWILETINGKEKILFKQIVSAFPKRIIYTN